MNRTVGVVLTAVLIASASIALHFKQQADNYKSLLNKAETKQLELESRLAVGPTTDRVFVSAPTTPAGADTAPAPVSASNDVSQWENRVRDLELAVQAKDRQIETLQQKPKVEQAAQPRQPNFGRNWEEDLKKTDPEKYKAIQKQREDMRSQVQKAFAEKADHFLKEDTSQMTDDEAAAHDQMLTLLNETWQLADQVQSNTATNRWQAMHQMRENMTTLEPALQAERTKEFTTLSAQLGYKDQDATAFVDYLNKVVDVTSMQDIYATMHRGRGPTGGATTNSATKTP